MNGRTLTVIPMPSNQDAHDTDDDDPLSIRLFTGWQYLP